jgi:hypothetical protein
MFWNQHGSCALGAASEAIGTHGVADADPYSSLSRRFPVLTHLVQLPGSQKVECYPLLGVIIHLNDAKGWSREAIAEYVETIEQEYEAQQVTVNQPEEVCSRG